MISRIIDLCKGLKASFKSTICNIKGECAFNTPDISSFTKEQKIAFDQMIDFLADMIEKYGDKIPKNEADVIKTPNKKTA